MTTNRDRSPRAGIRRWNPDRSYSTTPDAEQSGLDGEFAYLPVVAYQAQGQYLDPAIRLVSVTRTIHNLVGYTPAEWIDDGLWERAIHPDDHDRVIAAWAARNPQEPGESIEYRLIARDGAVVWVRDEVIPEVRDDRNLTLSGILLDITKQKALEIALQSNESRFFAAFEDAGIPLAISGLDGRLQRVNHPYCELFGYDADELVGMDTRVLLVPQHHKNSQTIQQDLIAGRIRSAQNERQLRRKDGSSIWAVITVSLLRDANGQPTHLLAQLQDLSEQRRTDAALQEANERYRTLVDHLPDIITRIDRDFRHLYINPAAEAVIGIPPARWIGRTMREMDLIDPLCDTVERLVAQVIATGAEATDDFRYISADMTRDFEIQMIPETSGDGTVDTVLAIGREVTARVHVREQLEFEATHDVLTGLLNRRGFLDRLGLAIAEDVSHTRSLAVLFIDLDDFKEVNDSHGHAAGDQVLIDVGQRLSSLIDSAGAVARLGGDEFAMMIGTPNAEAVAITAARNILETLRYPFIMNRTAIELSASIGIAVRSTVLDRPVDLLRWADIAMYQAKSIGKHCFVQFESARYPEDAARPEWERALRQAIATDELTLDYQPIVDLTTGEIVAHEALARWRHPRFGLVPPEAFIPFADEIGLAGAVTGWVLRRACADALGWPTQGAGNPPTVVVNLSSRQLADPDTSDTLAQILETTGLAPSRLVLDIPEQALMHHATAIRDRIHQLAELGVRIAIDNFGRGYTSLSCLRSCGIDAIKIDRSFISSLPDDPDSATIVRAIIGLAQPFGVRTIAVGVETEAQARWLRELGCDQAQGFAFGEPARFRDISRPRP